MLLVPGFAQTSSVWDATKELLSIDATALDIPVAGDFSACARALGDIGGRGLYAGYSMGGRLALYLAVEQPELVEHLVLVSANPGIRDATERQARATADLELAAWIESHSREEFLEYWTEQPLFEDVPSATAGKHRLSSTIEIADQLRRLGQGTQPPLWDRLSELRMPVTFVVGEHDSTYSDIATSAAQLVCGKAEVEVAPGGGHALVHTHEMFLAETIADIVANSPPS